MNHLTSNATTQLPIQTPSSNHSSPLPPSNQKRRKETKKEKKMSTLSSPTSFTLPPIRACIFDVDGLLINSEDIYTEIYNNILREYGKPDYPWSVKARQQSRGMEVSFAFFFLYKFCHFILSYNYYKSCHVCYVSSTHFINIWLTFLTYHQLLSLLSSRRQQQIKKKNMNMNKSPSHQKINPTPTHSSYFSPPPLQTNQLKI